MSDIQDKTESRINLSLLARYLVEFRHQNDDVNISIEYLTIMLVLEIYFTNDVSLANFIHKENLTNWSACFTF
jgi:hypothetical protein